MYLVLGGVTLVGGALFAGTAGAIFTWLPTAFPSAFMTAFNRIGPAGLASAVSRNPNGLAGRVGRPFARLLPWPHSHIPAPGSLRITDRARKHRNRHAR